MRQVFVNLPVLYHRSFEDPDGHIWELLHMRSEPQ
jgi:predicted lactoylglutathione lyase